MKRITHGIGVLFQFKTYTLINLVGLTVSLIAVFIIARYVFSELDTDRYIQKLDRLYITTVDGYATSGNTMFIGNLDTYNSPKFKYISKANGVELATEFGKEHYSIEHDLSNYKLSLCIADSNFLKIFDYPLLEGSINSKDENTILITYSTAKKLFGNESPIGKTLKNKTLGKDFLITGVLKEPSTKASLEFDMLAFFGKKHLSIGYQWAITLYPQVDYKAINKEFTEPFYHEYWNTNLRYQLFPYKDVHFNSNILSSLYERGNSMFVYLLILVGGILLIIGVINYSNIYTVVVMHRFKEFGIKKVSGIKHKELFSQLYMENVFICFIAIVISMTTIQLLQPFIDSYLMLPQKSNGIFDLLLIISTLVILPLLVSIFPFYRYQYNRPINSLKGIVLKDRSKITRNSLLFIQYLVTIVMLTVSFYFIKQLHFILNADLGYKTEQIIKVPLFSNYEERTRSGYDSESIIEQKMDESTLFENWTLGRTPNFIITGGTENKFKREGGSSKVLTVVGSWNEWLDVFGIEIEKGEGWKDFYFEFAKNRLILTKSAAKLLDIDIDNFTPTSLIPETPIWIRVSKAGEADSNIYNPYLVIGIIDDIFISHLGRNQPPVALFYTYGDVMEDLIVTVVKGREKEAIAFLENLHNEAIGGVFTYSFLEDEVEAMYMTDKKLSRTYIIFAILLVIITSIGLFAISLFDINRKYKEIGIRKINGATMGHIMSLLFRNTAVR